MKRAIIFLFTGFILLTSSCEDQTINSVPLDLADASVVYGDSLKLVDYINNLYTYVPSGYGRFSNAMLASVTDEAVFAPKSTLISRWNTGAWGPTYLPDNPLTNNYRGIHLTHVYRDQIHPFISDKIMKESGRNQSYAQVLFIRALLSFELLKRFGGYPIPLKSISVNEAVAIPRSTIDETVAYIESLCDSAVMHLPVIVSDANIGRATKGAAFALKSRLYLYAASKLYNNPDSPYDTVEHGKYDPEKWDKAASAAAEVINLKNGSVPVYSLGNLANNQIFTTIKNTEVIFSKLSANSNALEQVNAPVGLQNGGGGNCPTLDLVDAYYKLDGTEFDWTNTRDAANPFLRRDPRLAINILYNGTVYLDNHTVETFTGGSDVTGSVNATRTGFYLRKFMNPVANWWGTAASGPHPYVIFRYAEILLNYAEAMNEMYGPDADPKSYGMTARQAIKLIRQRAGLRGNLDFAGVIPVGDKDKMRTAIYKERQIELAFEDHRYFDLRRWKLAETVLNRPVRGVKITNLGNFTYSYEIVEVENRVFLPKMYYYPFPQSELSRNKMLIQNKDW
ncbi:MAG: RagB/SusD family nutrient uptake outer membrane protein [Paludibacter sp.]|jgi:hypothetical protein|nr:RagB/SusD family nutrient uptake outer membrane protein [Paludibacter sp.]